MILIDVQGCQTASKYRGIGRYIRGLVREIIAQAGSENVNLIVNASSEESVRDVILFFPEIKLQQYHFIYPTGDLSYGKKNYQENRRISKIIYSELVNKINPDIFLVTSFFEGVQDFVIGVENISEHIRKACIVYDFIPYEDQDTYLRNVEIKENYLTTFKELNNFDILLPISNYIGDRAKHYFPDKQVVPISSASDLQIVADNKSPYSFEYIFYAGGSDQRKNLERLLQAIRHLTPSVKERYKLVVAVGANDLAYNHLKSLADSLQITNNVELIKRPSDTELSALMKYAKLFVFPSYDEGFGLPVLEAMMHGTPAVCSNCTSLPEVIGWAEATFNPQSPQDIARVISKFLDNDYLYQRLVRHCQQQEKKFSWRITAKKCLDGLLQNKEKAENPRFSLEQLYERIKKSNYRIEKENIARSIKKTFMDNSTLLFTDYFLSLFFNTEVYQRKEYILLMDNIADPKAECIDNLSLFEFIKTKYPKTKCLYLINKESCQYPSLLGKYGSSIVPTSGGLTELEVLEAFSKTKIVLDSYQSLKINAFYKKVKGTLIKTVYSQHGVNYFKLGFLGCSEISEQRYDAIICSSDDEVRLIDKFYDFKYLIKAGLPRWDLCDQDNHNGILFYFTSREYFLLPGFRKEKSDFISNLTKLFHSDQFVEFVNKNKLNIYVALHHCIPRNMLSLPDWVVVLDETEISKVKNSSSILVTDYSSMCFDFMHANKTVHFFVPDYYEEHTESPDTMANRLALKNKIEAISKCCLSVDELTALLQRRIVDKTYNYSFYCEENIREKVFESVNRFIQHPNEFVHKTNEYTGTIKTVGEVIDFSDHQDFKIKGLSVYDADGRFTDGQHVDFYLKLDKTISALAFELSPIFWGCYTRRPYIDVYFNDKLIKKIKLYPVDRQKVFVKIPSDRGQNVRIKLYIPFTMRPDQLGITPDQRELCVKLHKMYLHSGLSTFFSASKYYRYIIKTFKYLFKARVSASFYIEKFRQKELREISKHF